MYCIYFSSVPIPKDFKGNPVLGNSYGYYTGKVKQKAKILYPMSLDIKTMPYIKWYSSYKKAENAAIKIAGKCGYVVAIEILERETLGV